MEVLKTMINKYPVLMLSKTWCPYCKRAKGVLGQYSLSEKDFHIIELDTREDGADIQSAAKQLTGQSTVPNIFIKGKSIGGSDNTAKLHSTGELKKLLDQATGKHSSADL